MRDQPRANTVRIDAPAKVNLFLEIRAKRPDGYHELETFMAAVDLFDNLEFRESASDRLELTCDDPALSTGPDNLVVRAAELLRNHVALPLGVRIHLTKRIPTAAGLAGGSSDAAATLTGLNQFWKLNRPLPELTALAGQLGSDVAFFLNGPAAWCSGRGEIVTPSPLPRPLDLVIACPHAGLSTAAVYGNLRSPDSPIDSSPMRTALVGGSPEEIGRRLFNRLQAVAEAMSPEVRELRSLFEAIAPGRHVMSGSGSGYFALADDPEHARRVAERVQQHFRDANAESPPRVFVVRTLQPTSAPP